MKKGIVLSAAALLAFSPATRADLALPHVTNPWAVTPGDTFSFDVSAYNSAGTIGYLITPDETVTFGTSGTFSAAGINGQDISYASSEAVNANGTTTDSITVSTPTNFLTTAQVSGTKMTQMQFDVGDANAGSNTLDYSLPVTGNTQTGNILYGTSSSSFTLTPGVTLTNNSQSLAAVEGVSYGTTAISGLAVHSFTFSVTYNTVPTAVPEPSTLALGALGLAGCAVTVLRRRRVRG